MLPCMPYVQNELLPRLRQSAQQTKKAADAQLAVWAGAARKPLLLLHCPDPDADAIPSFDLAEIHFNSEKMLLAGLKSALSSRAGGSAAVPSVRSNMGCGVYPTLLGMAQDVFPDKMPWIQQHLTKDRLAAMTAADIAVSPEFSEALSQMAYMKEQLAGTGVEVFPLDLQGVIDIAHLALGDQFFYELYDDEAFMAHLCDLSADAMIFGVRRVLDVIGPSPYVAHYNDLVMPASTPLKLSEDTTTLISAEHMAQYAMPATNRVLQTFGGGYMHYCGKNDHLLELALTTPRFVGLNFGNPDKHDMEDVLRRVSAAGKVFYGNCMQRPGETNKSYFSRLIKAQDDGRAHLLLPFHCPLAAREDVLSDWIACGGGVPA